MTNGRFTRKQRLTKRSDFDAMYASAQKTTVGPFLIHLRKNSLCYSRLGLSVPKRVGNAVKRNAIKRRCREAFKSMRFDPENHLDLVITVRPHDLQSTAQYSTFILNGISA